MTIFRGAALAAATVALVGAAYAGAAGPTRFSGGARNSVAKSLTSGHTASSNNFWSPAVNVSSPMRDASYFITMAMDIDDRRASMSAPALDTTWVVRVREQVFRLVF